MIAKKLSEAKEYVAPNHRACSTLRLFGAEAGVSKAIIAGVSHFLPGGGAGPDASPPEKVYYVLAGELTVIIGGKETVLRKNDSCYIGPNESREIVNRSNQVCTGSAYVLAQHRDHLCGPLGADEPGPVDEGTRQPGIDRHAGDQPAP